MINQLSDYPFKPLRFLIYFIFAFSTLIAMSQTVTSVSSTVGNGTYKAGDVIPITVTFNENVTVTANPQITLETGGTDAVVNYSSGTGTNILTFNYTVASDHSTSDLDYKSTTSLSIPIPNPGTPVYRDLGEDVRNLVLSGNYAYAAAGSGLAILSIPNSTMSTSGSGIQTNFYVGDSYATAMEVAVSGNHAYLAIGSKGLAIVDISDPASPGTPVYRDTNGQAMSVAFSGDYAYLSIVRSTYSGNKGLAIINISNPTSPGSPIYKDTDDDAYGVTVAGNYAYLAAKYSGLAIIDISDPTNPGAPVYEDTNGRAYEVTVSGNYAYVSTDDAGLAIIDISDPTNPGAPIYKEINGTIKGVTISGNYAYIGVGMSGLAIMDISNPISPGNPVYRDTNGFGQDLALRGNYAYVADGLSGIAIISTNVSSINDASGNSATITLPNPGASGSLGANKNLIIDTTPPTVTGVTSTTADGSYDVGNVVAITVGFSEVVNVTGTPQLTLETGSNDAIVDYSSGSGSNTLTFIYTVALGHNTTDLDYISTSSLSLNGGAITDTGGNAAILTLASPGASGSLGANKNLIIDTAPSTVTGVTSTTTDGSFKEGGVVAITVGFSEVVNVTGTPQLTLETGSSDAIVDYSSGSGSNTLTFIYTVALGHNSTDLDYLSTSSLVLNSGAITDAGGNAATLTLASPGASGSLGANKALVIDTTLPTVTDITSTSSNGSYLAGSILPIKVTFSETVYVTGTPQIKLETGSTDALVNYVSGSGSNTLVFNYTILNGHRSSDLEAISIELNGGNIYDLAGNTTPSTVPSAGASGSLGQNKAIVLVPLSFSLDKTNINENGTATITTTLDAALNRETVVSFSLSGTAISDIDYSTSYTGKGTVTNIIAAQNTGIFVDLSGNVYAANIGNHQIKKWAPGASNGTVVAGSNGSGSGSNQLNMPMDIALDSDLNIYIADYGNNRIQKWAPGASSGITVAGGNGQGAGLNQLDGPIGIALDKFNNVYVTDRYNHRVIKFAAGSTSSSSGTVVAGGNGSGSAANQLNTSWNTVPSGLYVDKDLNIYICDSNNNRVQKWANNATEGSTIAGLNRASNIDMDNFGNLYMLDYLFGTVKKWIASSNTVIDISSTYSLGLKYPADVFVDVAGDLYFSDYGNSKIKKLEIGNKIVVPSGNIFGTITINGIDDSESESDEIITFTPIVDGAILSSDDAFNINLLENDLPSIFITSSDVQNGKKSNKNSVSVVFTTNTSTSIFNAANIVVLNGSLSGFSKVNDNTYTATITPSNKGKVRISTNSGSIGYNSSNLLQTSEFEWYYDRVAPVINKTTLLSETTVKVEVDGPMYSSTNGSSPLEKTDFALTLNGGSSSLKSSVPSSILPNDISLTSKDIGSGEGFVYSDEIIDADDLDGDGDIDIVAVDYQAWKLIWYKNVNGSFEKIVIDNDLKQSHSANMVDIDSDGYIDILATSYKDGDVFWYKNNGNQVFTKKTAYADMSGAYIAISKDIDQDGDKDILATSLFNTKLLINDGSETFTVSNLAYNYEFNSPKSAEIIDFDKDGDYDILLASSNDRKLDWFENDGSESFTQKTAITFSNGVNTFSSTDMDGDGDIDIVAGSDKIGWYENDGSFNFTEHAFAAYSGGVIDVEVHDINGDGYKDIIAAMPSFGVYWHKNNGSQSFTSNTISEDYSSLFVTTADLDGDGDTDVLRASSTIEWDQVNASYNLEFGVNGIPNGLDTLRVVPILNSVFDAVGNAMEITQNNNYVILTDKLAPTMTITASNSNKAVVDGSTTNDSTLLLTFTSSEATTNFSIDDITVSGGVITNFNSISSTVYKVTLTPSDQGTITININSGVYTDAANNGNTAATPFNWTYNSINPIMTITASNSSNAVSNGAVGNDDNLIITFTSSKATSDFTEQDIDISGGTLSNFNVTSNTVYTATLTPDDEGLIIIEVAANSFTDGSGNNNLEDTQFTWTYDKTPPTMSITASNGNEAVVDGSTTNDSTLILTFTSSEKTTNFSTDDITVSGGVITDFNLISGNVYSGTFTPDKEGATTIDVAANTFTDEATNNNIAATQFNWTFNKTNPIITISATNGETIVANGVVSDDASLIITFTTSTATSDFTEQDITVTGGVLSNFNTISTTVYTAIFTPTSEGLTTIDVVANSFSDAIGNNNVSATQFTWTYDINNPPNLISAVFAIEEHTINNTKIGVIQASDLDGDTLTYSIINGNIDQAFDLSASSGELKVVNSEALDYETTPTFSLLIKASDGALSDSATVTINLTDVDEDSTTTNQAPTITSATYSIAENSPNGTVLGTVEATDPDGDTLTYVIVNGNDAEAFSLDSESGELTVSTSSALDFETTPTYSLGIEVSDGALSDVAIFTINLTDVEEEEETLSLADASEMIYPNPSDGIVNIKMAEFKEATIYNLSGKRIMRSTDNRIDVSSLSEGVYIIKLENRSGDRFSSRLIKE